MRACGAQRASSFPYVIIHILRLALLPAGISGLPPRAMTKTTLKTTLKLKTISASCLLMAGASRRTRSRPSSKFHSQRLVARSSHARARVAHIALAHPPNNLLLPLSLSRGMRPPCDRWWGKAAARGVMDAQFNLAIAYENGQGVRRSLADALHYFELASQQGDLQVGVRRLLIPSNSFPSRSRLWGPRALADPIYRRRALAIQNRPVWFSVVVCV